MGDIMDNDKNIYDKKPTTFEEQINILRSRNLLVEDEDKAKDILCRVNYYRLSAYMLSFKVNDAFKEDITLNDIYEIYCFDKKLRNLLVGVLESIEIEFRTHFAYYLSHKYGAMGYLDSINFVNSKYHTKFIQELETEVYRNREELFIKHHKIKYDGQVPLWAVVEIMSFGMLSKLYSNLKIDDKKAIALMCNGVHYTPLTSWLYSLAHIRNVCAHYGRIYDKEFYSKPIIPKKYKKYEINDAKIFARIISIKQIILNKSEWNTFVINLKVLIDEYEIVNLDLIGFPVNWYDILTDKNA